MLLPKVSVNHVLQVAGKQVQSQPHIYMNSFALQMPFHSCQGFCACQSVTVHVTMDRLLALFAPASAPRPQQASCDTMIAALIHPD